MMRIFQESVRKRTKLDLDVSRYQTWEEVVSIMDKVCDESEKGSGKRNAIRKFFDRLGASGPTFSAWLGLLPNGEYSSIVCGAFKLVIKVCLQKSQVMLDWSLTFSRLPYMSKPFVKQFSRLWEVYQQCWEMQSFTLKCGSRSNCIQISQGCTRQFWRSSVTS